MAYLAAALAVLAVPAGSGVLGAAPWGAPEAAAAPRAATSTTLAPWVPGTGGTVTVGIDQAPTGCNPNTASGDTWADRLLLEPVLPSAFTVNSSDQAVYNPALITQAELQSTTPETVVYTINPRAVWSDGRPVTAEDFVYTWLEERGTSGPVGAVTKPAAAATADKGASGAAAATGAPATTATTGPAAGAATAPASTTLPGATGTTGPALGYRQIASVTPGAKGRTVTVVFKRPYADWQSLFDDLLPAHVLEKTGWNPACSTLDPSIDLSAGPYVLKKVVPGKEVVLVRNARWWEQPPPPLDRIVVRIASGPSQLAQWLAHGTVEVALPSGYDQRFLQSVSSQPGLLSQVQPSTTLLQLELSTTSPNTASLDLRLAIAHAINRQTLINQVVGWTDSAIVPAASLMFTQTQQGYPGHRPPPLQVSGQPGYTGTTVPKTSPTATPFPPGADLAATSRLLAASGMLRVGKGPWTLLTGKTFALRMAVDVGDPWASAAAPVLVHQLDAAGLPVSVVDAPSAQAAGLDLARGVADMSLLPMHSSPYPSQAIAWYTPLLGAAGTGGSQDWSNLDDPTVDALLEKASQQLNPVDAGPLYTQVDAALWQQMVALPLFTQPVAFAWSGRTAGVSLNPNGPSLLWAVQNWAIRVPPTSPKVRS
ncbi:MAG: ABC transporter family substrate-binding protein [Acidimicrobiales bacterium]